MLFGISIAPEEFQRRMHTTLQDLSGVEVITDDILVFGCGDTAEEWQRYHDTNLQGFLQRAREKNLKLNKKKLKLCQSEVSYMGHHLTRDGLRADPAKVRAIKNVPRPDNKKVVEWFLGCMQYLSCFLPQLSEVAALLQVLTEQSAIFTWQTHQEEAFQALKDSDHQGSGSKILRFGRRSYNTVRYLRKGLGYNSSTKMTTSGLHFALTD